MMDTLTFEGFMGEVGTRYYTHPDWRYGQTLFNVLHEYRPDLSEQIRGTDADPFHADGFDPVIGMCLIWIQENW